MTAIRYRHSYLRRFCGSLEFHPSAEELPGLPGQYLSPRKIRREFLFREGDLVIRPTNLPLRFFRGSNICLSPSFPPSSASSIHALLPCFLPSGVFLVLSMLVTIIPAAVRARHNTLRIRRTRYRSLPQRWYNGPAEIFGVAITDASKHVLYMVIAPLSSDPQTHTFRDIRFRPFCRFVNRAEEVRAYRNVM